MRRIADKSEARSPSMSSPVGGSRKQGELLRQCVGMRVRVCVSSVRAHPRGRSILAQMRSMHPPIPPRWLVLVGGLVSVWVIMLAGVLPKSLVDDERLWAWENKRKEADCG